jgi:hypothetical protein
MDVSAGGPRDIVGSCLSGVIRDFGLLTLALKSIYLWLVSIPHLALPRRLCMLSIRI